MKRIVVCCDGTWNTPDKTESGLPCETNVVKLAEAVKPTAVNGTRQLLYYDPGIGTSGSIFRRMFDGATGRGLTENILEAYKFLILNYELGDELFFFGFSRGAFTVRSLAGFIRNSGILAMKEVNLIERAFRLYRSASKSTHPKEKEATLFRKTFCVCDIVPIKFIGVWDTVGSLGNPLVVNTVLSNLSPSIARNRFHDTDLSSTVNYAYQALAIDEKRRNFKPAVWRRQPHAVNQTLEQVWFVGSHSNIGGGYPQTGLSDISCEWLISKAKACGLEVGPISLNPNSSEKLVESWKGFYRLALPFHRPIPSEKESGESVHDSVIARYHEDPKYRPNKLVEYMRKHGPGEVRRKS